MALDPTCRTFRLSTFTLFPSNVCLKCSCWALHMTLPHLASAPTNQEQLFAGHNMPHGAAALSACILLCCRICTDCPHAIGVRGSETSIRWRLKRLCRYIVVGCAGGRCDRFSVEVLPYLLGESDACCARTDWWMPFASCPVLTRPRGKCTTTWSWFCASDGTGRVKLQQSTGPKDSPHFLSCYISTRDCCRRRRITSK